MPKLLIIDNYDSFTYNLVQYFEVLGARCDVFLNDQITVDQVRGYGADGIVLSPGPCTPDDAGVSLGVLQALSSAPPTRPILGVCLGHQSIGQIFGGKVIRAPQVMHGKTSPIYHDGRTLFRDLPNPFDATRYHSLIVDRSTLPDCLEISAWTSDGIIMALRHRSLPIEGVQFHPESILTTHGLSILKNFVGQVGEGVQ